MSSTLIDSAQSWLNEADYLKVFKPWWDTFEDFAARGLFTVGVLGLVVRYLSSLDSGVLQCVLISIEGPTQEGVEIPGPAINLAMAAYASLNQHCTSRLVSVFAMYGPLILFGQAMILIALERFIFFFPSVSNKMEKFYKAVLLKFTEGEDCDLVEDFCPTQSGTLTLQNIIRKRQQDEICASLKRSSLLFFVYIIQNTLQSLLAIAFLALNSFYANQLYGHETDHGTCKLELDNAMSEHEWLDPLKIHSRHANLQCQQKRLDFFVMLIIVNCVFLCIFILCNMISLFWIALPSMGRGGRISNVFRRLRIEQQDLIRFEGRDFLLLFDLYSHTHGLSSSLRILSHCSPTFADICSPDIDPAVDLVKTEHSLKICWRRSQLQNFSEAKNESLVTKYKVSVASSNHNEFTEGILEEDILLQEDEKTMCTTFSNLKGGDTFYMVTVAPVINSSRLKGKRIKTKLLPSPPKNLSVEFSNISSDLINLHASWSNPDGYYDLLELRLTVQAASEKEEALTHIVTLPKELTEYTFTNLPGDRIYKLRLFSRNGKEMSECEIKLLIE